MLFWFVFSLVYRSVHPFKPLFKNRTDHIQSSTKKTEPQRKHMYVLVNKESNDVQQAQMKSVLVLLVVAGENNSRTNDGRRGCEGCLCVGDR
eukprot:m.196017 g.196017  ORF g.196017 m.196017 type:complete len:92 (+) comp32597_c0_seq1:1487-1762(+)